MKVVYAQRARTDIGDIYDYLVQKSPQAALRVEDMVRNTCEGLADFPYAAVATDEPNVRRLPRALSLHDLLPRRRGPSPR